MKFEYSFLVIIAVVLLAVSAFGADRALVVGIDGYKYSYVPKIEGGIADAEATERVLLDKFGFKKNEIRKLTGALATSGNIRDSFENWLIKGSNPGDRVFFFYSGHGSRVDDDNGDEEDKKDEVLAPYDVEINKVNGNNVPKNFIRDDEVNVWISQLAGRQVVLVVDSCNSGTISRSLNSTNPKASKFLNLETIPTSRGIGDDVWSYNPKPGTRDLSTVVDKYMDDKTPNVVVISAAQPNQLAVWLDVNGGLCNQDSPNAKYRGALAYLFEKAYQNGNPTLSELNNYLTSEMERLQNAKIMCKANSGVQKPDLEFSSAMGNQTMWGMTNALTPSWENSAITALQNPLSKIKIDLKFSSHSNSYKINETINYTVGVSEPAFVYVAVFSRNDVATMIFPWSENRSNFLEPGKKLYLDGVAQEPLGKDVWVVIAAKNKIRSLENLQDNKEFKWNELFELIGTKGLRNSLEEIARTRGVGNPKTKLEGTDWQTATVVMATLPK